MPLNRHVPPDNMCWQGPMLHTGTIIRTLHRDYKNLYMGITKIWMLVSIFKDNVDIIVSIFCIQEIEGQKWNIQYS